MFLDARKVEVGTLLRSNVCIVGGGVAGITLALEFERHGIDCLLLESGGFAADEATRDLCRGENIGLPYVFADGCRSRFLGGSSNCWGGWCSPLREHDMEQRDWVPESGWPFARRELQPYYERAHPVLRLGPVTYDVDHWVAAINRKDVRRIPLPSGRVEDSVSQFSSPSRLGSIYRDALQRSKHVRTCLYANVVDIETDASAQKVLRLLVKSLNGRSFHVEATQFVLACGGIENARLLLASNQIRSGGVGNAADLVGRYFTDHPRLIAGHVRLSPNWSRNRLYDAKLHYMNRAVSANGTFISAQFSIARKVQQQEGLLNSLLWFSSVFPGEGTDAAEALIRMKHRLHGQAGPEFSFSADLALLARHPIDSGSFIVARLLQPASVIKKVQIEVVCEPSPNRDSRITLSRDRDQLGMPRVRVDWRLGEQVKRTFDRSVAIFGEELRSAGVADVELAENLEGREWPEVHPRPWHHLGIWHHMGTTRMNDSPTKGVVNRDCKIHGMANLYIAGSSVFPTYGTNYPTITIVALSLKLADHLVDRLRSDHRAMI
jgi:choline dehydrogenase-like flavoprotein